MKAVDSTHKVIVPAGSYWLGDPCYSVPNDLWDDVLDSSGFFNKPIGTVAGFNVLAFRTAYGDGVYRDQHDNDYPVDAGLIGLTPVELAGHNPFGSHRVTFYRDTECTGYDGVMQFGDYKINTRDDDPNYDDEDDEDD